LENNDGGTLHLEDKVGEPQVKGSCLMNDQSSSKGVRTHAILAQAPPPSYNGRRLSLMEILAHQAHSIMATQEEQEKRKEEGENECNAPKN